ncbi:hypothetical protein BDW22DRAFT_1363175 [Trametopsis cervina]|nr:hypothetical protein BDW22DRAFT_1363175 [Trametopsis cervina]
MATEDEEAITKDLTLRIRSIRTALRGSEKAISQERELLKRLIELVTCPYSSVKIVVARNITAYIKSFEDLEDDAINAVYDLCEDQDPVVRIEGYRAITQVSSHLPKYVKRNADVLVQLLQSDEPTEVGVVEGQLLMHLDKDPTVTLNVLCDQIVPPEEPLDEEDQTVRDRLRSLVIEFMRGRAKRGIIRHADKSDSGPDTALVNRVLNSISRMNPSDIEILIKDIIVSLPAYTPGSARSLALVQALVDEAEACYRREWAEAQARHGVPLKQTQHFMALAYFISVEKRLTSPAPILQFWCPNKILESVLQQHEEEFRLFVFNNLGTYGFLEDGELDTETLSAIQSSIAAASVPLFSSFVNMPEEQKRPWNACRALLSACKEHASKTRWKVPQKLASLLQNVQSQADQEKDVVDAEGKKSLEQVQDLTLVRTGQSSLFATRVRRLSLLCLRSPYLKRPMRQSQRQVDKVCRTINAGRTEGPYISNVNSTNRRQNAQRKREMRLRVYSLG